MTKLKDVARKYGEKAKLARVPAEEYGPGMWQLVVLDAEGRLLGHGVADKMSMNVLLTDLQIDVEQTEEVDDLHPTELPISPHAAWLVATR